MADLQRTIYIIATHFSGTGGTERALINLANNLYNHGDNVGIISIFSKEGTKPFFALNDNIEVEHLQLVEANFLKNFLSVFNKLAKKIKYKDSIIIGTVPFINIILAVYKKLNIITKSKCIGCEHVNFNYVNKSSRYLSKLTYKFLDKVVVLTEYDKDKFISIGLNNVAVIPNELSFYPEEPSNCLEKRMLAVGRFNPVKNFAFLLEVVKKPLKIYSNWRLALVGDGIQKNYLIAKIKELELEKQIDILPFTPNIEMEYLNSSIYLLSSNFEGFPMVLLEAKSCGIPIISHDCPAGPREIIINNQDGFLTEYKNKTQFENAIIRLMEDENLRVEMGKKARENSLIYSDENIFTLWENLFTGLK